MQKISIMTIIGAIATSSYLSLTQDQSKQAPAEKTWQMFEQDALLAHREASNTPYFEFLRTESLNCGLYVLPAGAFDGQSPHDDDEVYYIIKGRGVLRVEGEDQPVMGGSIIYVKAGVEHQFRSIDEDLSILVFFAEGPRK